MIISRFMMNLAKILKMFFWKPKGFRVTYIFSIFPIFYNIGHRLNISEYPRFNHMDGN